ncbi:MarR family winged helix-turn-helix transcriptional regulator [Prauserella endophytica]|uniref:MarR family transcriptional regulator n=1 Tax=Prauserella endophytica TaxID=1592324 RepID=A0ABY2RWC7_9PSEU|nr:MarR family transcriptional regulator [Prauserella endophytica]TKG62568.1 MarR family transcriptional regulator [Prauserella endophytica]
MTQEPPPVPSGRIGYLLARAGGRAIRNLNRALEPYGLRSRHYTVLSASAEHGGLSQRELGLVLGADPSAVVALVDDLQRKGLVRRDPHPEDRRTRLVVVTEEGARTLAETRKLARGVDDELLADLGPAERRTLEELLLRLR